MSAESQDGEIWKLWRAVRELQTASPLERSAVQNGRVRFIGGELRIDSGGQLVIEGTLSVDGVSTVTGSFTVSGPWSMTGNGTITGATSITGNTTITGKLVQDGLWELNGNGKIAGTVDVSGRVNVGSAMALDPSADGGSVLFGSSSLKAASGGISMQTPNSMVVANSSQAAIGYGLTIVEAASGAVTLYVNGDLRAQFTAAAARVRLPTRTSALANGAPVGTVWSDTSGNLYRVIA